MALAWWGAAPSITAAEQSPFYPSRPITLIVPDRRRPIHTRIWRTGGAPAQPNHRRKQAGRSGTLVAPALRSAPLRQVHHRPIAHHALPIPLLQRVPWDPLRDITVIQISA
jgi:hypothetical protein